MVWFWCKQKTEYERVRSLGGSERCRRDSASPELATQLGEAIRAAGWGRGSDVGGEAGHPPWPVGTLDSSRPALQEASTLNI